MKAQLLIDKDEFNNHVDEVRTAAVTSGLWQAVNMFHQILQTKTDPTRFGENVSEEDKAKWNAIAKALVVERKKKSKDL